MCNLNLSTYLCSYVGKQDVAKLFTRLPSYLPTYLHTVTITIAYDEDEDDDDPGAFRLG